MLEVLLVCGIVLFGLGLILIKITRSAGSFLSVGLGLIMVSGALLHYGHEVHKEENIKEFIIDEANRKYNTSDAYITEKVNDKKFEVIAGNKIIHAYIDEIEENTSVDFLEVGVFEGQRD